MDEHHEVKLVIQALRELACKDRAWDSNYRYLAYTLRTPEHRIVWWRRAKLQAEKGVPAMRTLLLEVIRLRLTT